MPLHNYLSNTLVLTILYKNFGGSVVPVTTLETAGQNKALTVKTRSGPIYFNKKDEPDMIPLDRNVNIPRHYSQVTGAGLNRHKSLCSPQ